MYATLSATRPWTRSSTLGLPVVACRSAAACSVRTLSCCLACSSSERVPRCGLSTQAVLGFLRYGRMSEVIMLGLPCSSVRGGRCEATVGAYARAPSGPAATADAFVICALRDTSMCVRDSYVWSANGPTYPSAAAASAPVSLGANCGRIDAIPSCCACNCEIVSERRRAMSSVRDTGGPLPTSFHASMKVRQVDS
eukprot:scaffold12447_cov111-Isochrysis_galbana.AAC.1